ncbi:MCE family protein [Nocardioides sp. GY 10113]|uniref:MCE family protein n=1 Tax=Nocardioides sp. GY 10113 TaxID=2569761 RepID=UPI0010A8E833|nr:MCE family protein [Nocardioides sp. GY 10113]TIC89324.1 MCE family protein [Nocardioides sp. GY 10113]
MNRVLAAPRLLGVVFVVLLLVAVYLTYAAFTKKFADYEEVTLQTSTIGLQLPDRADVKIRGVLVGEVLATEVDGPEGATVTLGLYPDQAEVVPANVTGAILPKTLFGEKYVSLVIPESGPSGTLAAGAVIPRTEVSTEVEEVLADFYPLLRAVRPADLNATLSAISTALEGRGEQLGENLETVDAYLKRINPQIPALLDDIRLTAEVADTYADILPDVARILDDTVKTTGTLEAKETVLNQLLRDVRSFSTTATGFLAENGQALEEATALTATELRVLARYSPLLSCLPRGIDVIQGRLAEAFRGYVLHIILEFIPNQPRSYDAGDKPHFGADNDPNCLGLPDPVGSQANPFNDFPNFDDGVDRPTGKGTIRVAPGFGAETARAAGADSGSAFRGDPTDLGLLRDFLGEAYAGAGDLDLLLAAPTVATAGSAGGASAGGER